MFRRTFVFMIMLGLVAGNLLLAHGRQEGSPARAAQTADLQVVITATEKPDGTDAISEGQHLTYGGGAPSNWVKFTIINRGNVKAENFTYKMVLRDNGIKVYDPPAAQMSLGPHESKTFGPVKLDLRNRNEVEAKIIANVGRLMPENNMTNNIGSLRYTASVAQ